MAYSDGNSVTVNTQFGVIVDDTTNGLLNSAGYPCSMACAYKYGTGGNNLQVLTKLGIASLANDYIQLMTTTSDGDLFWRHRNAPASGPFSAQIGTALASNTWHIVAANANNGDVRHSINGAGSSTTALTAITALSGCDEVRVSLDTSESLDTSVIAWAAFWSSQLTDGQMEGISAGTTDPTTLSPDYFIYFEGTSPYDQDGSASSDLSTAGTGSFTSEGTDPTGWPPSASGGIIELASHHFRFNTGSGL